MQTIGERLEEARKRRGISLREASEALKIRAEYLQSFEGNAFDIGLPEIYVRGFLRNYADYLKIDAKKVASDYAATVRGGDARPLRERARENLGRLDLGGGGPSEESDPPAVAPSMPPPAEDTAPARPSGLLVAGGVAAAVVLVILLFIAVRGLFSSDDTSTARPAQPPVAVQSAQTELGLICVNGPVTVTVVQIGDGATVFTGTLQPGERRAVLRSGPVRITVDPGSNLQLERDGQRFRMTLPGRHSTTFD